MRNIKYRQNKILLVLWLAAINLLIAEAQQSPAPSKTSGFAPVNNQQIYYEVCGNGDPIVLLHGAYLTIELNWGQIIPELSKTRKVIALELQGHGRTMDTDRPFSYNDLADDVRSVMQYLKVNKADIIGYSFGGTVALQFAIQNPEMVNKLIIISTVFKYDGWSPELRQALASFQPEFLDNTPLKVAYDSVAPDPAHWHQFVSKLSKFDTQSFNLGEDNIRSIGSPTLLIMGDNDGVELTHKVEFYKLLGGGVAGDFSGLPKSGLAIVPGSTHVSLMMDYESILYLVNKFLNQT